MIRKYIIEEDGDIVVNKKECILLPEFKVLFDRDKGSKNDLKGKHQLVACGELKYIYYNYDPRSEFFNTPPHISHEIVRELSGLPDNWKTDKVFEKAVEMYKKLQRLSSAGSAYFSADSALYELGTDTKEVSDMIRELKNELKGVLSVKKKVNKEYNLEDLEFVTKIMGKLDTITSMQNNVINLINKMPGLSKTIKVLKEAYSEEDNENNIVVGNRTLGNRED
jgi:Zn-dependent M32 family carboxypeptidase